LSYPAFSSNIVLFAALDSYIVFNINNIFSLALDFLSKKD